MNYNIRVKKKEKSYNIFIANDISAKLKDFINQHHNTKRVAVITDYTVNKLYGNALSNTLKPLSPFFISLPPGEQSKSRKTKEKIEDILLKNKFGKDSLLIAFGGGVIGDLAGFVASTFSRGVALINIPTTLLAMIDSSIGGKTSVNTKYGKNLIGTIYQPDAIFAGLSFLTTLPHTEFMNGLAEIAKIAIVCDRKLFDFLRQNYKKILLRDENALLHIVKRSTELKKNIVEKDAEETGLRQILNFGHTFGHALEAYSKFKMKHGYAISMGIVLESKIAVITKNLVVEEEKEIVSLLRLLGFPVNVKFNIQAGKIIDFMIADKKARQQKPRFVILKRIGKVKSQNGVFSFEVNEKIIKKTIDLCESV